MFLFQNMVAISLPSLTLCWCLHISPSLHVLALYRKQRPWISTNRYSRCLYHFLPPQGESSNCVFGQGILGGDPGGWVMAARSPSCHPFTSRLLRHGEPIWTPRLVEIQSGLWADPWGSWSTVYKLYISFPGGNWELGFLISSLCIGKERRYGISDHRLLSPSLLQAAWLWDPSELQDRQHWGQFSREPPW